MREAPHFSRDGGRTPCLPFDDSAANLRRRVQNLEEERERLLAEVLHLQRVAQTGLMTCGLAHDLANHLTVAMGTAEEALQRGHTAALREGITDALERERRMHEVVESFLAFVRRGGPRVRELPVADVIERVRRLVEPVARGENVEWIATCTTSARLRGDGQLLSQALVNLSLNAIRAAAHGGRRVIVSAAAVCTAEDPRAQGHVCLSVRDTGPGISENVRRRLFEPFVSGAPHSGAGLGLYVVRQIVERSGGRLRVESTPAGTRFDVELPIVSAGASD